METKKIATREAYGQALAELAQENPNVVVLDADLSKSTKTADFAKVAPERFINCGIAEADMIGVAAGLSACGKVPFASSFAVFAAGRAFEQIRNSVCYPRLNVKVAATHAGITVGEDGGSHQAIEDISLMRTLPNMSVLVPSDAVSAKALVKMAADYVGPVYLRLGRLAAPVLYEDGREFTLGGSACVRSGKDIVLFACGMMVAECLAAAELLAQDDISATVIDMYSIKPLDVSTILEQAREHKAALSVEEHSIYGGLGSAVAETLAEGGCGLPFARIGMPDSFGQSGKPADLVKYYRLDGASIAAKAKELLNK